MTPALKQYITSLVSNASSVHFTAVGGGSINQTFRISAGGKQLFCKLNSATNYPGLFEKEAAGLRAIRDTSCILTPGIISVHEWNGHQVLLLEWIESGLRTTAFWEKFGQQLAEMHQWKPPTDNTAFGLDHDNYMGELLQHNAYAGNWCDFFREQRLKPQVALAAGNKLLPARLQTSVERLYLVLPEIFSPEPASFLHGDLWSGNFLCNDQSAPVLIDPAVYFGHRSIDLAMTTLFGGFEQSFYDAYAHWYPFPVNYREQWEVCNLYPLLIHLNLFGESYLSSIGSCLRRFD